MIFSFRLLCIVSLVAPSVVVGLSNNPQRKVDSSRRSFLVDGASSAAAISIATTVAVSTASSSPANAADSIASRLDSDILNKPAPSYASEFNGIDNTYFPSFLEGTWETTQTLLTAKAPLGMKYLGGPNGDISIAERSMKESLSKVGMPVNLKLRYVRTRWGVAEDRLFNNRERLNAFAGKDVVANVQYADVGGSNRKSVMTLGGTENDPLQTIIIYFKGPAAQKIFLTSHGSEKVGDTGFAAYELQRSIFALTNQSTRPPITTDTEYIWKFDAIDKDNVKCRLRIAEYLDAQNDKLYFETRNRAVSYQEYSLDMKRI